MPSNAKTDFPPKLYLFMKAEYLASVLINDEIKVCLPQDCNDIMELCSSQQDETHDKSRDRFKYITSPELKKQLYSIGFVCFSQDCQTPTMWSHYADKHRGVCLEFDFPVKDQSQVEKRGYGSNVINLDVDSEYIGQYQFESNGKVMPPVMMKVNYRPFLPHTPITLVGSCSNDDECSKYRFRSICATKGCDWSYEQEWRLIANIYKCMAFHGNAYFLKGLTQYITRVLLGAQCALGVEETQVLIDETIGKGGRKSPRVEQVRYNSALYRIDMQENAAQEKPSEAAVWNLSVSVPNPVYQKILEKIKQNTKNFTVERYIQKLIEESITPSKKTNR